ncbi:MerR family transcriptional regulator [Photobacterium sp. CCB-ST2H9]|uniref:MerR family transcriptional regulator n=1 Tax=unclassified Photobacterium TaxID=2628852 RepID=UPI002002DF91|nr:MerR family transcriptional regulator [Photobacterium sp. CCB-ST2H9]UTM59630.1 MerR family transcriptional regulator [Photobacterium sp. CCB-ST2H9]
MILEDSLGAENQYQQFLKKVKVGIHEASDITGVPTRKIRYWQEKGYIETTSGNSSTRQYDLINVKKIILIQELIDDGYTLDGAANKVNQRIDKLKRMFDLVLPTSESE